MQKIRARNRRYCADIMTGIATAAPTQYPYQAIENKIPDEF